jgi:hypothetical protein
MPFPGSRARAPDYKVRFGRGVRVLPDHFLHYDLRFCGVGVGVLARAEDHTLHELCEPFRMVFCGIYVNMQSGI